MSEMGEKALWPMVAVVFLVCGMISTLVIAGVEVVTLIAILGVLFTGVTSLINVVLYGKMQRVEQNTNGNLSQLQMMVERMLEHARNSIPLDRLTDTRFKAEVKAEVKAEDS